MDGQVVGYGTVGRGRWRGRITEFYVLPKVRGKADRLFREFAKVSKARAVEAQTNDVLLTLMLYDCAQRIRSEAILSHDRLTTSLTLPGAVLRKAEEGEKLSDLGDYVIETDGQVAASGGILFHYNPPYGDIYMDVAEPFRRRGIGSFLVQELKRTCYEMGKTPAARCSVSNAASRATLQKVGFVPCARMLRGTLRLPADS